MSMMSCWGRWFAFTLMPCHLVFLSFPYSCSKLFTPSCSTVLYLMVKAWRWGAATLGKCWHSGFRRHCLQCIGWYRCPEPLDKGRCAAESRPQSGKRAPLPHTCAIPVIAATVVFKQMPDASWVWWSGTVRWDRVGGWRWLFQGHRQLHGDQMLQN